MSGRIVLGDLRVQRLELAGGREAFTIVWPEGAVHDEADGFLRQFSYGTQRTYAYLLVDHLRWLDRECLALGSVSLRDLERYMGLAGAQVRMPLGEPWRAGKRPYGRDALSAAASCIKGFYLYLASEGVNRELGRRLAKTRLPSRADRQRSLLGYVIRSMPANPLAPRRARRRHPKMLPEGAREALLREVRTARDRLVVTWLADGGFRIGELCGLHLSDLHLQDRGPCGDCRVPHAHVCHREGNANRARAKTKYPWGLENGLIQGGLIKRVSPAMIHTYFDYMSNEYPRAAAHSMLLVQLQGPRAGQPWAADAARGMLARAGRRAGLGPVNPHAFRHSFATAVLDASGGNLLVARDAGGWSSTVTVDEIYGHADVHDPVFDRALRQVWERQP
jgi:integrase